MRNDIFSKANSFQLCCAYVIWSCLSVRPSIRMSVYKAQTVTGTGHQKLYSCMESPHVTFTANFISQS